MTSEIDKLKHFYIEDYSGIYFTDELKITVKNFFIPQSELKMIKK